MLCFPSVLKAIYHHWIYIYIYISCLFPHPGTYIYIYFYHWIYIFMNIFVTSMVPFSSFFFLVFGRLGTMELGDSTPPSQPLVPEGRACQTKGLALPLLVFLHFPSPLDHLGTIRSPLVGSSGPADWPGFGDQAAGAQRLPLRGR